jgi:hypothetical protein
MLGRLHINPWLSSGVLCLAFSCKVFNKESKVADSPGTPVVSVEIPMSEVEKNYSASPPVKLAAGTDAEVVFKNAIGDGQTHLFRFSITIYGFGTASVRPILKLALTPDQEPAQDIQWEYSTAEDSYRFEYIGRLGDQKAMKARISGVDASLNKEMIYTSAVIYGLDEPTISGKREVLADTTSGARTVTTQILDTAKKFLPGKVLADGEYITYNLSASFADPGPRAGQREYSDCPQAIGMFLVQGSARRDITAMAKCSDGSFTARVDLIANAANPISIEINLPQQSNKIFRLLQSLYQVQPDGTGQLAELPSSIPLTAEASDDNRSPMPSSEVALTAEGAGKWTQGGVNFAFNMSADYAYSTFILQDVALPVSTDPGIPLPDYKEVLSAFNLVITANGGVPTFQNSPIFTNPYQSSSTGSFTPDFSNADGAGILHFDNPRMAPGTPLVYSLEINGKNMAVADLTDDGVRSIPIGNPGLLDFPVVGGNPDPYWDISHYDDDVHMEEGKGITDVSHYNSELPPKSKYGPDRIPLQTIVKVMEDIRNHVHERMSRSRLKERTASNWVDDDTVLNCVAGNAAPHWSDLQLHFYCQLGNARSCYTGYIRDHAAPLGEEVKGILGGDNSKEALFRKAKSLPRLLEISKELKKVRSEAFFACKHDAQVKRASNMLPDDPESSELEWVWLTENKERENVFRLVMEAPTFAMDYDMQQRLLNLYYRVTKSYNDNPDDVPAADCKAKRPPRQLELRYGDSGQIESIENHCKTSKILFTGQSAQHR